MQTLEGYVDMRLRRPWYWPFRKVFVSRGKRIPTFIPRANEFARKVAEMIGGTPLSMITEILFDIPGTALILGACPMGGSLRTA
jgi:cholesterol oxidase